MSESESERVPAWARAARSQWLYTGKTRPPFARVPQPGERSVWDFPRPPALETVDDEIRVRAGGQELARSTRGLRVLETGGPPTYYLPSADVRRDLLEPTTGRSQCEWKGEACYWELDGETRRPLAWSYPNPFPEYARLRDHFSFYAGRVECFVGSVRALPQPGGFYGGWVTPELVGPFKGEPGTESL